MAETQVQRGQQWLETFLKLSGFPASVKAEVRDSCWLTIDHTNLQPAQVDALLGNKGAVLDSIQYLASSILNIDQGEQMAYTIELNGYREQRYQELADIAETAAAEVRSAGGEYEIKSLSSAERRQVHSILQGSEDIETFSRGQEPDRRLVVKLAGSSGE
jgi:spoIIIJ-associated protein